MVNKNSIKLDNSRDSLFPDIALIRLRDSYLQKGETPQEGLARASAAFADDEAHAQRIYDYVSKHWFAFSTPILANGGKKGGLGISCFLQNVPDTLEGLTHHFTESVQLTANGGGLGGYWGNIRTSKKGGKGNGMVPWLKVMDSLMLAGNQTETRRGSYAAYLDVSHPEIEEFIEVRDPNGDHNRRALGIGFHHAVCLSDDFMAIINRCAEDPDANDDWPLIDPHTKEVVKVVSAKMLWGKMLGMRRKTGEPYMMFVDTANRELAQHLKDQGLKIWQSNLCNEIYLPTGVDKYGKNRTAICCLSSVNLAKWDEWKDQAEQMLADLVRFLDNVVQHFIDNAPEDAHQAAYAASRTRDLGIGAMGFHHLLQSKSIPFESSQASKLNEEIFYLIGKYARKASRQLGEEKGYYPDAYGENGYVHKARNAHVLAIAPNASSAIICGNTSPSCEPYRANAYKLTTLSGSILVKNPVLQQVLASKGKDTNEVWSAIIATDGSVQHLDFLTDHEKLVFKTFFELDQIWVVEHASIRQSNICQGQSVNLAMDNDIDPKYLNYVHREAYNRGLKGLYYLRGRAMKSNERISVVKTRETVRETAECLACE